MVMPVQVLNCFQEVWSESDSGLRMEANMVTLVPACPAYAWNWAQSPVRVAADPEALVELPDVDEPLEQAASSAREVTAPAAMSCRRHPPPRPTWVCIGQAS